MDELSKNILAVVLSMLVSLAIFGNLLIIISALTHKVLRGPSHVLILNLAISDFLLSTFCLPLRLKDLNRTEKPTTQEFCFVVISLSITLFGASNFNLFLLTTDRFFGVVYPLLHKLKLKIQPVRRAIIVSWSIAVFIGFLPYSHSVFRGHFGTTEEKVVCTYGSSLSTFYFVLVVLATLYLPLCIMIIMYVYIVKAVLRSLRFGKDHSSMSNSQAVNRRASLIIWASSKEVRLAKGVLVILGVYTLSLGPIAVIDMLRLASKEVPTSLLQFALAMAYINPTLNPPIYAASCEDYRKCCLDTLTFGHRLTWGAIKKKVNTCFLYCYRKLHRTHPETTISKNQGRVFFVTRL